MNQTEIRKEPRDCFAVLQLFPEPYRQKVLYLPHPFPTCQDKPSTD